jgi:hypothetical protein
MCFGGQANAAACLHTYGDHEVIHVCTGSRFTAGKTEFTLKLCAGESYILSLNDSSGSCTFM